MSEFSATKPDAKQVLDYYGINKAPVDVIKICEEESISIEYVDFSELEAQVEGEQISGAIYIDENLNKKIIYVRKDDSENRQRFTIAHELGHYFQHRNSKKSVFVSFRRMSLDGLHRPALDTKESQANNFAAELLMPEELLQKEYAQYFFPTLSHLSNLFKVSKEALKYRLRRLRLYYVEK